MERPLGAMTARLQEEGAGGDGAQYINQCVDQWVHGARAATCLRLDVGLLGGGRTTGPLCKAGCQTSWRGRTTGPSCKVCRADTCLRLDVGLLGEEGQQDLHLGGHV